MGSKANEKYHDHLSAAAKEAKRQYNREWYRKNKDKMRAARNRYWEKKGAELAKKKEEDVCQQ